MIGMRTGRRLVAGVALLAALFAATQVLSGDSNGKPPQLWSVTTAPLSVDAQGQLADGKVAVSVSSPRTYGYRLGDLIYIEIVVEAKPGVQVSLEPLQQRVLMREGSNFEMVQAPSINYEVLPDGVQRWTADMVVRFWVPNPEPFTAEILYSPLTLNGGHAVWTYVTTPPVQFGYSNTAPAGAKQIDLGPQNSLSQSANPFGWVLFWLAIALGLLTPLLLFGYWWRRRHPPVVATDAERFWSAVERITADTLFTGWQETHYKRLAAAFRHYLQRESETLKQMGVSLTEHPKRQTILSVQTTLDDVLYAGVVQSGEEQTSLFATIEEVVPRPHYPVAPEAKRGLVRRFLSRLARGLTRLTAHLPFA